MTPVRLEPAAPRSRVKHSTTEPLRSLFPQILFKMLTIAAQSELPNNHQRSVSPDLDPNLFLKEFFEKVYFEKVSRFLAFLECIKMSS